MADKELIASIVRTYDLSPLLEERIMYRAIRRIDELFIDGFDNIYEEVDRLVQMFTHGNFTVSLDRPIKPGSEEPLSILIGQRSVSEPMPENDGLSRDQILDVLRNQIDATSFKTMQCLLLNIKSEEILFPISADEIVENAGQIQHKLEELIQKHEQRGRLILPQRTIIEVKFDPLQIKYSNRFYNGNPLAFFQKHQESYKGLGRGELSLIDPGLYMSLRRYNQLDEAIPLKNRKGFHLLPLTSEQINKIIENHLVYKGDPREAARHLPHDRTTIIKYWKQVGLEIKRGKRGRKQLAHDRKEEIIRIFLNVRNITEVVRQTHHSRKTILKYLEENGIDVKQYRRQHKHYPVKNSREYRLGDFRGYPSPLEYFRANQEKYNGLRRTELFRRDSWLYQSLLRTNQMDEAIPETSHKRKHRRFQGNPLAYFRENEEICKGMTRGQLRNFDQGLWVALRNANQLDQAIPKTAFRGHSTPLDYIHANSEQYKNLTKTQLKGKDKKLYRALRRLDQLDEVASPSTLLYREHKTPLDYFRAHFQKYREMTRTQLSLADSGLYRSLVRREQLDEAIPL